MVVEKTNIPCGTLVKIVKTDDKNLIGAIGRITHPFCGLMVDGVEYIAGLRLETKNIYLNDICNLTSEDEFQIIDN